jgi:hypothetical protein
LAPRARDLAPLLAASNGELRGAAGAELRLSRTELRRYPDGRLDTVPVDELAGHVLRMIARQWQRDEGKLAAFDAFVARMSPGRHRMWRSTTG